MKNPFEVLEPEELAVYQWQYRMHGGFFSALFEAIARADQGNLERLRQGFPVEVGGYLKFSYIEGWWERVLQKVEAEK